jgi:hypothetical protein
MSHLDVSQKNPTGVRSHTHTHTRTQRAPALFTIITFGTSAFVTITRFNKSEFLLLDKLQNILFECDPHSCSYARFKHDGRPVLQISCETPDAQTRWRWRSLPPWDTLIKFENIAKPNVQPQQPFTFLASRHRRQRQRPSCHPSRTSRSCP